MRSAAKIEIEGKGSSSFVKKAFVYAVTLFATYWFSWTVVYVFVNGLDLSYYFTYWIYALNGGGERPAVTFGISAFVFLPLSVIAILIVRYRLKRR
jgi:hypothetical protein